MRRLKKLTVLGIAAALMVVTCAAAGLTGLDQRLMDYFGAKQEEQLSSAVVSTEPVSHTYPSGWTVQIGQVLADRYMATVVVDIIAPENVDLAALVEEEGEFWIMSDHLGEDRSGNLLEYEMFFSDRGPGWVEPHEAGDVGVFDKIEVHRGGILGAAEFDLLESTDLEQGHISALWTFYSYVDDSDFTLRDLRGGRLRLSVAGLRFKNKDTADRTVRALFFRGDAEEWTYQIDLPETDPGRIYTINKPIQLSGEKVEPTIQELTTIYLSPLELTCDFYRDLEIRDARESFPSGHHAYTLNMADGTTVSMRDSKTISLVKHLRDGGMKELHHISLALERLVDPDDVVSVTIMGQTYQLK